MWIPSWDISKPTTSSIPEQELLYLLGGERAMPILVGDIRHTLLGTARPLTRLTSSSLL
jgi:hypothetical protein